MILHLRFRIFLIQDLDQSSTDWLLYVRNIGLKSQAARHRYYHKKVLWKYAANIQENTYAKVQLQ